MEVGLMIRYGKLVPGREAHAIGLFDEALAYFKGKLEAGTITFFEPFFMSTSDFEEESGFFLLKGPAPATFGGGGAYLRMMEKGSLLVEHCARTSSRLAGDHCPARAGWKSRRGSERERAMARAAGGERWIRPGRALHAMRTGRL
jgi:hypothetical protein